MNNYSQMYGIKIEVKLSLTILKKRQQSFGRRNSFSSCCLVDKPLTSKSFERQYVVLSRKMRPFKATFCNTKVRVKQIKVKTYKKVIFPSHTWCSSIAWNRWQLYYLVRLIYQSLSTNISINGESFTSLPSRWPEALRPFFSCQVTQKLIHALRFLSLLMILKTLPFTIR